MKKVKVSVIMSEYNTPIEYLRSSIMSILRQTYTDFEFIIIDDRGFNKVNEIAQEYSDDRLRVVENSRNRGLVYSLNRALHLAQGEYLVRMDTDDIAMPNRIEKLVEFMTNNPEYDVAGSRVIEFSMNSDAGTVGIPGENTIRSILRGRQLVHPSVIMRKSAVMAVGGYPDYKRAEDLGLWCALLLRGSRLYIIDDVLLKYRVNIEDYSKRKLKYRMGEMRARLHYYPKFHASVLDYARIFRLLFSSILPNALVQKYRNAFKMDRDNTTKQTLVEFIKDILRPIKILLMYYGSPLKLDIKDSSKRKIIVALAADYGNLGDKAIEGAQIMFLKSIFIDSEIVIINVSDGYMYLRNLKKILRPKDIITLLGGGNTGSIYPYIENQRRTIIKKFTHNPIVAFPQSIYFGHDWRGRRYLKKSVNVYSNHKNLHLFARDLKSYTLMKECFPENYVGLAPDIVLSHKYNTSNTKRAVKRIVLTLRSDSETAVSSSATSKLIDTLKNSGYDVTEKDTEIGIQRMPRSEGRKRVQEHLDIYAEAEAVITDRLHGMIFCAITNTPCIALDNSNGKVHEFYNTWLKAVPYIKTAPSLDAESVLVMLANVQRIGRTRSESVYFKREFQSLIDVLMGA